MLILTVPFKFDTPSPDDMVITGLKSSRNFRKRYSLQCLPPLFTVEHQTTSNACNILCVDPFFVNFFIILWSHINFFQINPNLINFMFIMENDSDQTEDKICLYDYEPWTNLVALCFLTPWEIAQMVLMNVMFELPVFGYVYLSIVPYWLKCIYQLTHRF